MIQTRVHHLVAVLFLLFVSSLWCFGSTLEQRMDPILRMQIEDALNLPQSGVTIQGLFQDDTFTPSALPEADTTPLQVLIKVDGTFHGSSFRGFPVTASTGSIVAISATARDILTLLEDEDIVFIEAARQTAPLLDVSVPAVYGDVVHNASPPILGTDVIVGAIDTGIDYTHLDFRYDADGDGWEESSRILAILDQSYGLFGIEYTQQDIETDIANHHDSSEGIVREKDTDGHGTHVMGIAAGDGSSSEAGFIGMAPGAWIVMVKTTFFTSDILAGIEYIFDLADDLGLPAVVNLSLGGHEGPHDGTSLFEQGIDELAQAPGHIVVVSAGNEGNQSIHASKTLLGNASVLGLDVDGWEVELDLWYPGTSRFTVTLTPPSGSAVVAPWGTDTGVVMTPNGTVRIDNASTGANPSNGDYEAFVRLSGLSGSGEWGITITDAGGTGGTYDAWITSGSATFIGGDSSSTIDEPGNANEVITVGSFNTKAIWESLSGQQNYLSQYPLGVLSSFSSQGPTRDGRRKPDICAPGAWISAALSSDALWQGYLVQPDGVHTMELGTSMAAPHVAGAVALMLSINPSLTIDEVRPMLTGSAMRDSYTGAVPNDRWGFGKLNVAGAVAQVDEPETPPVEPPSGDEDAPAIGLAANPVGNTAQFVLDIPTEATWAEVRIYSASGRLVYISPIVPSAQEMEWALITNQGEPLASGLYLYVLVTNLGSSEVGKLVIAR